MSRSDALKFIANLMSREEAVGEVRTMTAAVSISGTAAAGTGGGVAVAGGAAGGGIPPASSATRKRK